MFGHLLWQQSHQIQPIITCCSHCECYWQADERESLQATLNLFLSNSLRTHGLLHWTVNPCKGFTYMHAHIEHRHRNNLAKWLPCSISLLLKYKISSLKPKCKSVFFFLCCPTFSPPPFLSPSLPFPPIYLYHLHWHLSTTHPSCLPCLNYLSFLIPFHLSFHPSLLLSLIFLYIFLFLPFITCSLPSSPLFSFSIFQSNPSPHPISSPLLSLHLCFPRVTHMVFKWSGAH